MQKIIVKLVLIISILVLIIIGIVKIGGQSEDSQTNNFKAIPYGTSFFVEINELSTFFEEINNENEIWNHLSEFVDIETFVNRVSFIDSVLKTNDKFKEYIGKNPSIISAHKTADNETNFLFVNTQKKACNSDEINEIIAEIVSKTGTIEKSEYNDIEINKYTDSLHIKSNFSYAVFQSQIILSSSMSLLKSSIRQLKSDSHFSEDFGFTKIAKTAGKNSNINVYINFKDAHKVFSSFLNKSSSKFLSNFSKQDVWSELDFNIRNDEILLNGFTYANDSGANILNIINRQSPIENEIQEIFPSSTSAFFILSISDISDYFTDYKTYLSGMNCLEDYKIGISSIETNYFKKIEDSFISFFDNEIAIVNTDYSSDISNNSFVIVKTKSQSLAEENMLRFLEQASGKSELPEFYNIDNEIKYPVYKFPLNNFFEQFLGGMFSNAKTNYFSFIDNYLVFANSQNSLRKFILDNVLEKKLINDNNYLSFADNLNQKSNVYIYSNIAISPLLYSAFANKKLTKSIEANIPNLQKFQAIAIQLSSGSENLIYNDIFLKYNPVYKEGTKTVWERKLDTCFNFKPNLVINHLTKKREIFIQDESNKIYLINKSGVIIWEKQIDEPIVSNIFQIDFYKNSKLQLLFSTKNKIHLIDRNGNYVERYPIKMNSPASNGIAVFDYEKSRNYRIFVAGEDKRIVVYSKEGNIVKGWKFSKSEHLVYNPIQHFRVKTKDYIVFSDKYKTYILDRKGNVRVKMKNSFAKSSNNQFTLEKLNQKHKARLVSTDSEGKLHYIYFDGTTEKSDMVNLSKNHFFDCYDVDSDGYKDYIFVDENNIEVKKQNGKLLFSFDFDEKINERAIIYSFPKNEKKIGVVSSKTSQIYLFNSDGSLYSGFPLRGNTLFSIASMSNSNDFNLFVGGEDCMLYNYKVKK